VAMAKFSTVEFSIVIITYCAREIVVIFYMELLIILTLEVIGISTNLTENERRYWVVRLGGGGRYVHILEKRGQIAIGWNDLGNLSWLIDEQANPDKLWKRLRKLYEKTYEESPVATGINCGQVWNFVYEMEENDVILVPTPERKVLIGKIIKPYQYKRNWKDECRYLHRREVKWLKKVNRDELPEHLKSSMNAHLTVFNVDKHKITIEQMLGKKMPLKVKEVSGDRLVKVMLDKIRSLSPREFEEFVSHLLGIMGFETVTTEYVGDRGVDVIGILNAEGLTNIRLKVQVRRVQGNIGIKEVQRIRGTLAVDEHGAIISTSGFTLEARREAEAEKMKPISLVDGETLVDMILRHYDMLDEKYKQLFQIKKKEPLALKDRFIISTVKQ